MRTYLTCKITPSMRGTTILGRGEDYQIKANTRSEEILSNDFKDPAIWQRDRATAEIAEETNEKY